MVRSGWSATEGSEVGRTRHSGASPEKKKKKKKIREEKEEHTASVDSSKDAVFAAAHAKQSGRNPKSWLCAQVHSQLKARLDVSVNA